MGLAARGARGACDPVVALLGSVHECLPGDGGAGSLRGSTLFPNLGSMHSVSERLGAGGFSSPLLALQHASDTDVLIGDGGVLVVGGVRGGLPRVGPQAASSPLPLRLVPGHPAQDRLVGCQSREHGCGGPRRRSRHGRRQAPRPRRRCQGRRAHALFLRHHHTVRTMLCSSTQAASWCATWTAPVLAVSNEDEVLVEMPKREREGGRRR